MVKAVHAAVDGRTRFQVEGLYRNWELKFYLESFFEQKSYIRAVSANILTGKILILYPEDKSFLELQYVLVQAVADFQNGHDRNRMELKVDCLPASRDSAIKKWRKNTKHNKQLRWSFFHSRTQEEKPWHLLSGERILKQFRSNEDTGYSAEEAEARLQEFGPNILSESVPRSGWDIILHQLKSPPVWMLGIAAGISLITGGLIDAAVILSVVSINTIIGYFTEMETERTIHSLKTIVRPHALVKRDGREQAIQSDKLVPGDILILEPGCYVPADARILYSVNLSVDESALTGESMPVLKTHSRLQKKNIPLADRINMVYKGTLVIGGHGLALTAATGAFTQIGQIQSLVEETKIPETPLEKQLDKIGGQLAVISGCVCAGVFGIGLLRGYGFLRMLQTGISLAVAAVPEGLPAVATTTLALGIRKMRQKNVIIRRLEAVETLGSIQTICLDKTGTITYNRMQVEQIHSSNTFYQVRDGKFSRGNARINPYSCPDILKLIHISVLCSESEIQQENGQHVITGSSTENALMHMAIAAGVEIQDLRQKHPVQMTVLRSGDQNIMFTLHKTDNPSIQLIAAKGNPSELLSKCGWILQNGKTKPLTETAREDIHSANEGMAGRALRVLGMAYSLSENGFNNMEKAENHSGELIWLGMAGMTDPIREGVKNMVSSFHRAGIDTVMVTGDQTPTAYAYAKELNISGKEQIKILDSTHLMDSPPEVIEALSAQSHVFARVSPAHKLQILQGLQRAGKTVAMTGDGINDGPALKAADIGIAMGHSGTDVAREVADVILEDDNLETMIIAVSQGRSIYNNIRKSIHFLLSTNMSEIMVMFGTIAMGAIQPLNARQLLWINLLSDIFPGIALAMEAPEPDVLAQPPRDPAEPLIQPDRLKHMAVESGIISTGAFAAYGYGVLRYGKGMAANTLTFTSLTAAQLLHAFSCRSEKPVLFAQPKLPSNKTLNAAVFGSLGLQVLTLFLPGLRRMLELSPLHGLDYLVLAGTAAGPLFINEALKQPGDKNEK